MSTVGSLSYRHLLGASIFHCRRGPEFKEGGKRHENGLNLSLFRILVISTWIHPSILLCTTTSSNPSNKQKAFRGSLDSLIETKSFN